MLGEINLCRDTARQENFRVGFLIAGVQKAGTSSLFEMLAQHPDIGVSRRKEVHYFDDESLNWLHPDYNRYHTWFDRQPSKSIYGEATPIYVYWPTSLDRVQNYNSLMKLIILFRDPIQRAYSHWCAERSKGREALSFPHAIRGGRARLSSLSSPQDARRWYSYVERGWYANQLSRARSLFHKDNILALDGHSLRRDPSRLITQVTTFLGLSPFWAPAKIMHVNRRRAGTNLALPSFDDIRLLAGAFAEDLAVFEKLVEFRIDHWPTWQLARGSANVGDVFGELTNAGF